METYRIVEVFSKGQTRREEMRGSGFLISRNLVLTSRHVVSPSMYSGICQVRFFITDDQQSDWRDAKIIWTGKELDAALLSPVENGTFLETAMPIEFGRLSGQHPIPVNAVGFAEALTLKETRTDTIHIYGNCFSQDSMKSDRIHINVELPIPKQAKDWEGVSGAVVVAGDIIIGVLEEVPKEFKENVLLAVPIKAFVEDVDFCRHCKRDGISIELRDIDSKYVASVPDTGWAYIENKYRDEVVKAQCQFRLMGITAKGSIEDSTLYADRAFTGMRFNSVSDPEKTLDLKDLLGMRATVIMGDPGTGKSGILKMLLFYVSQDKNIVPILLPLSSLAKKTDISATAIIEVIADQASSQFLVPQANHQFFLRIISQGRCLLFLDALDELPSRSQRENAVQAIRDLFETAHGNRFFLTSRCIEYEETHIPFDKNVHQIPFCCFKIVPFTETEIRDYLKVWFDDAGDIANSFLGRKEHTGLPCTPLVLNLFGCLARSELPNDLFALYETFMELILNSREDTKAQKRLSPSQSALRDALEKLAWTAQKGDELFEDVVIEIVKTTKVTGDPAIAVDWLVRRSCILTRQEQYGKSSSRPFYLFAHHQIQEFLAGCELANRFSANLDEAFTSFSGTLYHDWWYQTLRFAVLRMQRGNKHSDFLRKVISHPTEDGNRPVLLAATLLSECDPVFTSESISTEITNRLIILLKSGKPNDKRTSFKLLLQLAKKEFSPAYDYIEKLAVDYKALENLLFKADDFESLYIDTVCLLVNTGSSSAQDALNRAVRRVSNLHSRLALAPCWVTLGQAPKAL